MNSFVLLFVIISSVAAFDNFKEFKSLCKNSWSLKNINDLVKLVKNFKSEQLNDDCDHSVGFHFNTEVCDSFQNIIRNDYPRNFSAFLSDGDRYLYIYVTPTNLNLKASPESPEKFVLDVKSLGFGYFPIFKKSETSLFVLWIKEKITDDGSSYSYRVGYNYSASGNPFPEPIVTKQLLKRSDKQLILKDLRSGYSFLTISFDSKTSITLTDKITIKDSYVIFCAVKTKKSYNPNTCKAIEENERIRCDCSERTEPWVIYLVMIIWSVFAIIATKPIMELFVETGNYRPLVFQIHHNCDERNFRYKYILVLRLSKSSLDFDLKNVTIDVEFFSQTDESIAPLHRFKASYLENRPFTEVKIIMWRLTKMPELKKIVCSHSGKKEGKICLLGVQKYCQIGENDKKAGTIHWYKVVKSIYRTPRHFNLRKHKPEEDVADAEERPLRKLSLNYISLTFLEMILILFVDVLFMAWISCQFLSLSGLKDSKSVVISMMVSILFTTFSGIVFNTLFVLIYKYLRMKRVKEQLRMNQSKETIFTTVVQIFYVLAMILALILSSHIILTKNGQNEPFIVIYRWFVVTLVSSALTALVWYLCSYWQIIYPTWEPPSEQSEQTVNSGSE